jgi:hypothetical protein
MQLPFPIYSPTPPIIIALDRKALPWPGRPAIWRWVAISLLPRRRRSDIIFADAFNAGLPGQGSLDDNKWRKGSNAGNKSVWPTMRLIGNGFDAIGDLAINGAVYLRLRFDNNKIHFKEGRG